MSYRRHSKQTKLRYWHYLGIRVADEMKLEFGDAVPRLIATVLIFQLIQGGSVPGGWGLIAMTVVNSKIVMELREAWRMVRETETELKQSKDNESQ